MNYKLYLTSPLVLLHYDLHISLGPDGHAGGDGEALHLHHQGVVIVVEILPAKPRMGFKIHLAAMNHNLSTEIK